MSDLTITTTHRTALRLLPATMEFLARQQLAHVVPSLVDAGLVDCRGGLYGLTDSGRRFLAAHERARADAALRRWRERIGEVLVQVDALEREIHEQHNHDLGQWHTWLVRGVEVLTRQARDTLHIADVERARVELVETVPPEQRSLAVSHLVDAWMHHVELAGQAMLDRAEMARAVAA